MIKEVRKEEEENISKVHQGSSRLPTLRPDNLASISNLLADQGTCCLLRKLGWRGEGVKIKGLGCAERELIFGVYFSTIRVSLYTN